MQLLEEFGTGLHHKFPKRVKYLQGTGTLWELREHADRMHLRIVYSPWEEDKFVMLHGFVKDQRTEPNEIERAKRYWSDWQARDHD
jgi:phage-related protein